MLSALGSNPPKKIAIKIARAENLELHSKSHRNKVNTKFKVSIIGGKKKLSSLSAVSELGIPSWDYSCVVKLARDQRDPLCLVVEDSDGNHKGQVIIPIVKIAPKPYVYSSDQNPATSNNLLCSELEPTQKCSKPQGYLLYWCWVESNYTEEEMDVRSSTSRISFNKSMHNIFGSKRNINESKLAVEDNGKEDARQYGSVSVLNKPVKHHKKVPSLIKLKFGGGSGKSSKKAAKHNANSASDYVHSNDGRNKDESNSDVDDINSTFSGDYIGGGGSNVAPKRIPSQLSTNSGGSYGSSIFMNNSLADSQSVNYRLPLQHQAQQQQLSNDVDQQQRLSHHSNSSDNYDNSQQQTLSSSTLPLKDNRTNSIHSNMSDRSGSKQQLYNEPLNSVLTAHDDFMSSSQKQTASVSTLHPASPVLLNRLYEANRNPSPINTKPEKRPAPPRPDSFYNSSGSGSFSPTMEFPYVQTPTTTTTNQLAGFNSTNHEARMSMSSPLSSNSNSLPRNNNVANFSQQEYSNEKSNPLEKLKQDNSDLHRENINLSQKLDSTESELNELKDKLFRLRLKLLEDGATKYLEI